MQLLPDKHSLQRQVSGTFGAAGTGASGAALGTVAESSPTSTPSTSGFDPRLVRAERYALTAEARRLMLREGRRQGLRWHHKVHRTAGCMYIPHGKVHVHHSAKHGRSFFSGVQVCGSPWSCPVCAAKIAERRRIEVQQTIDWAYETGQQPMMVTLTFPHQKSDDLGDLLDKQREALQRLRKGRTWDLAKKRWGFQGLIRALEMTHSERAGWHPHTHEVWVVSADTTAGDVKETVLRRWKKACIDVGLLDPEDTKRCKAFDVYAVDVRWWISTGDYLAKLDSASHWGIDSEMARASSKGTKSGKKAGTHPFGLLRRSLDGGKGSDRAGKLYVDFVQKVAERRARSLFFTPGLKKRVGIDDLDDAEIALEQREEAMVLGQLTRDDWKLIRSCRAQAAVLDAAELEGWDGVILLLGRLAEATGSMEPDAKRRPLAEVREEAEAAAAERAQERHDQAAAQKAMSATDAALAAVSAQAPAVHEQMLADAAEALESFQAEVARSGFFAASLAFASGGREATEGSKGACSLARPQVGNDDGD